MVEREERCDADAHHHSDPLTPPPPPPPPPTTTQLKYSWLMASLKADNVTLNRRTLADLAAQEPASFAALCARVKQMRGLGDGSAPGEAAAGGQ